MTDIMIVLGKKYFVHDITPPFFGGKPSAINVLIDLYLDSAISQKHMEALRTIYRYGDKWRNESESGAFVHPYSDYGYQCTDSVFMGHIAFIGLGRNTAYALCETIGAKWDIDSKLWKAEYLN